MEALYNRKGVMVLNQEQFSTPPPRRQAWVNGLGDFWGEAMATAVLSMCFLAGEWAGFSVRRLREEMDRAAREDFRARQTMKYNEHELQRARRGRKRILIFSILTLGIWWLVRGRPWTRPQLHPVEVPHILPAPYSPRGLDWLLFNCYIRREDIGGEWFIFPEPKLARETRWLWDPPEES